ncbi:hypothetical protein J1605_022764 [Eschrichtius robustus]|uniref:LIM zinc-binding domain-containing protein n=1 Tax=Eschrichtius robustus TaxID=9764 RepID=A0AB34H769_ESCRO|nr:hypothetical protein J1605_022764 [Eschrichtius robustus]
MFHSRSGPEVHGVIEEMDRRAKSEAPAISSAINHGDTETTMPSISSDRAALCAGCRVKISDRYYLLAVDTQWHVRCLKCCECKLNLESELTCFSKDGSIYCKEDYYRRFSVQHCAHCHLRISASEMVMRAWDLVYHLNCFTCTTCNKMLTTGDHFRMKDRLVYRRLHFEALLQGECPAHFNHADVAKSAGHGAERAAEEAQEPRARGGPGDLERCTELEQERCGAPGPRPAVPEQPEDEVHAQLLQAPPASDREVFAINHNPDAKDLKQLAQKTGLTKRVLQVSSQNAQAKFRRNLVRRENTGMDKSTEAALQTGTP